MKKVFEAIASLLNVDAETFVESLQNGVDFLPEDEVATKVADTIRAQMTAVKDEQHKRGRREQDAAVQKWMKAQGFTVPSEKKGAEIVEAFIEWKESQRDDDGEGSKPDVSKLTKEELLKSPVVKQIIADKLVAAEEKFVNLEKEHQTFKQQIKRSEVENKGREAAAKTLREKGAILEVPGAGITADDRLNAFFKLIDWTKVGINDANQLVMLDTEGNIQTDDFGKAVLFETHVVAEAKPLFGFSKTDPKKDGFKPGEQTKKLNDESAKFQFADVSEYNAFISRETDQTKRLQAMKDWQESQAGDN